MDKSIAKEDVVICFIKFVHWKAVHLVDKVIHLLKSWDRGGERFCKSKVRNTAQCQIQEGIFNFISQVNFLFQIPFPGLFFYPGPSPTPRDLGYISPANIKWQNPSSYLITPGPSTLTPARSEPRALDRK